MPPAESGMHILADYQWQAANGAHFGVFVFARAGLLAGLEVWSVDGLAGWPGHAKMATVSGESPACRPPG